MEKLSLLVYMSLHMELTVCQLTSLSATRLEQGDAECMLDPLFSMNIFVSTIPPLMCIPCY
jgi:hypothetical protein